MIMNEPYRPNTILSFGEKEALNEVRRRANQSGRLVYQLWPLAVVLVSLGLTCHDSRSLLIAVPAGLAIVYLWNSYRQGLDQIAVAINGLYKIAEEAERRNTSPS
jgi:hypothetical protein